MPSLSLLLLGTTIGGYGTLIGAGGGFLLVPALLFLFPAAQPAVLTSLSLAVVALNALSGSVAYARRSRIDYHVALVLSVVSVPGTTAEATEPSSAVPPAPATGRLGVSAALTACVAFVAGLVGIGGSPLQVVVLTHVMHLPVHVWRADRRGAVRTLQRRRSRPAHGARAPDRRRAAGAEPVVVSPLARGVLSSSS